MSDEPFPDRPGETPGDREWQVPPSVNGDWDPSRFDWGAERDDAPARAAGVGKRVGAYIIDSVILAFAVVVLALLGLDFGIVPSAPEAADQGATYVSGVVLGFITLAYFVLMEAATGQTLGKRLLRIRATMADGRAMTAEAAFKRRVLFVVGAVLPVIGNLISFAVPLAALVTAVQDPTMHQGFHDRWARTRVVDA